MRGAVLAAMLVGCSFKDPWDVEGAPSVPPDLQYRTGVEVGEDVYVWRCYQGQRVVVTQGGSAFFGASAPRLRRAPCGPGPEDEGAGGGHDVPESKRWPGSLRAVTSPSAGSRATSPAP